MANGSASGLAFLRMGSPRTRQAYRLDTWGGNWGCSVDSRRRVFLLRLDAGRLSGDFDSVLTRFGFVTLLLCNC